MDALISIAIGIFAGWWPMAIAMWQFRKRPSGFKRDFFSMFLVFAFITANLTWVLTSPWYWILVALAMYSISNFVFGGIMMERGMKKMQEELSKFDPEL